MLIHTLRANPHPPAPGIVDVTLPGTHITPCGGELPWPTSSVFSPADAVVQAVKETQQADLQRLSKQLVGWMDSVATRA